jgi:hypothetical protein
MFHTCKMEVRTRSSLEVVMMAVLQSQSGARDLQSSLKQMPSCASGMTRSSQHVGSGLVEPGARSGPSRGRALVRNRIGEDPTFNRCFTRCRPPKCGRKELRIGPVVARTSKSSVPKGGSERCAEHRRPRPHGPRDRAIRRNRAGIRVPLGIHGGELLPVMSPPAGRVGERAGRTDS